MPFKLSASSRERLQGVHPRLVSIVEAAIKIATVDFGVTCGLRTQEEQAWLYKQRKTMTMESRHLTGHAVDLVAYLNGQVCREGEVYDEVADAMRTAVQAQNTPLRWGGAWQFREDVDTDRWRTEDIC